MTTMIHFPREIARDPSLSPDAKLLALAIIAGAAGRTESAVTHEIVVPYVRISRHRYLKGRRELLSHGWLAVSEGRADNGQYYRHTHPAGALAEACRRHVLAVRS